MPNWCENSLTIRSEVPGRAYAFYEACKGKPVYWGMHEWELEKIINPEDRIEARKKDIEKWEALPLKFTFNALVPVPQEIINRGYSNDGGNGLEALAGRLDVDGYHWCINHWGTKWDVYGGDFYGPEESGRPATPEDTEICCSFDTAWSPPLEWAQAASAAFPGVELEIEYFEPGGAFGGKCICKDGQMDDQPLSEEEFEEEMKERGYWDDPDEWKQIYDEVTAEQAKALFSEGKAVYGIDEDGIASKVEIEEDLGDYETFAVSK